MAIYRRALGRLTPLRPAGLVHGVRRSANRRSGPRRVTAAVAAGLAIIAWFAAIFVWTTTARVTSPSGFASVAAQTIQSPEGAQATTEALLDSVTSYAASKGYDLTPSALEQIGTQITAVIEDAQFPEIVGPALQDARRAYEAAPDGPITIDLSALRPIAVAKVQQVNPALVKAIPPDADLTVTVQKGDVPPAASTVAGAAGTLMWLPLWLALGAALLGVLAMWASGDRPRMMRVLGIGSLVIAVVPLVLFLAVPPITSSFAQAGTPSDLASVGASAILGHWWISLIACLVIGVALLVGGIYGGRSRGQRRPPLVLGR
jgi:hypothetical protein